MSLIGFADQSPATPYIVLGLFIFAVMIMAISAVAWAAKKVWQTRKDKKARGRKAAIILLIIVGLYALLWIKNYYFYQ